MPRARNIKYSFFTNEILASLCPLNRLLFIGLWCLADREGRLEERLKKIEAEIFPYDEVDIDSFLFNLEVNGFIKRYKINGSKYIQIVKFVEHQKPHKNEKPSKIPCEIKEFAISDNNIGKLPEPLGKNPESFGKLPEPLGLKEERGKRKEERGSNSLQNSLDNFLPNDEHREIAKTHFVNIDDELAKFRDWHKAKGGESKDWDASFRNWLRKSHGFKNNSVKPVKEGHQSTIDKKICSYTGCKIEPSIQLGRSGKWYCSKHKQLGE